MRLVVGATGKLKRDVGKGEAESVKPFSPNGQGSPGW